MGVGQLVQDKERDLWLNFLERLRHVCYAWGQGREEDEMWKRKKEDMFCLGDTFFFYLKQIYNIIKHLLNPFQ